MGTSRTLAGLIGVALGCGAVPALAHHSSAMFDPDKVMEITGTVREFQWKNPHIWIQVNVKNAGGLMEEWSVEGGSPNSLSRQGWRATTFKPGDVVSIKMHPTHDGSKAGEFLGAKLANGDAV